MNVDDVVKRVQHKFGDEAGTQVTQNDIIRYINDGQKELAYKNEILQAIGNMNIVGGDNTYPIPSDLLTLRTLYYDDSRLMYLKKTDYDEYINRDDPKSVSQGIPVIYTRWANEFYLYPVPAQDLPSGLKLEYTQRPADVSDLTDELSLPLEYHSVLVDYCMQQAYETDENFDGVAMKAQQIDKSMDDLASLQTFPVREYFPTITVLPEDM